MVRRGPVVNAEAIVERLLASGEPSVRWKVRVHVLGEPPGSRPIRALQDEIRDSPRVRALLAGRDGSGRLAHAGHVYAKWQGAHWILTTLADIGYPAGDRSLLPARDQLLECWLDGSYFEEFEARGKASAYRRPGVPVMEGRHRRCASQQANALFAVLSLGLADERADRLVERLLHWQWPDGGWNCDRNPGAGMSSLVETVWPIRALSLYARERNDGKARAAAKRAAEVLLARRLYKRRSTGETIHRELTLLHYPPYWHFDILAGLKVLAESGFIGDPRCRDALDLLASKRLPDGGWPAEKRYYTKVSTAISLGADLVGWGGTSGRKMNEWVTADALHVLRAAGRLEAPSRAAAAARR